MTQHHPSMDPLLSEALRPSEAPADLRAALLAEARRQDSPTPRSRRFRALMAAAALMLFVGGGTALVVRERGTPAGTARGALKNYLEVHELEFQGQAYCPQECAQWSRKRLGFEAPVPAAYADQDMVGGRACSVNGRPVAHYLLKDGRALYVFKNPIGGCESRPAEALAVAAGLQAKVWNEQGRGYVLVEPSSR